MHHLVKGSNMGCPEYSIDEESDIDLLPKRGIITSSLAHGIINDELKVYYFTQKFDIDGKEIDGEWKCITE